MRKVILSALLMFGLMAWSLSPAAVQGQELIHYWNFNDPVENGNPWPAPVEANTGDGEITYNLNEDRIEDFGGSTVNAREGDSDGASFSIQRGPEGDSNNGRYFDLEVSTEGFEDIELAYATQGTGSGFDEQEISYSTDGGANFTVFDTITPPGSYELQELDFSGVTDFDDNPDVVIRITLDGATGTSGNNRFDNITVEGEPASTSPPTAGTSYELFAAPSDLNDVSPQCLTQIGGTGLLVFFDGSEIYVWDGSDLTVHTSSADLNNNIAGVGGQINRCDGVTADDEFVYFVLRSTDNNVNQLYRTEAADASNFAVQEFDGANGLAVYQSTLYIAAYELFGAPNNGIWQVNDDLSNTATELASDADLSIDAIDVSDTGMLYGYSNSFGSNDFESTIFSIDVTQTSPSFDLFVDPYANSPLSGSDDIEDLEFVNFENTGYLVVYNAPNADEWATIRTSDQEIDLLFTSDDIVNNTSIDGYTGGFAEPMTVSDDGEVFVASRETGDSSNYIARVSGAAPLPVELATFTAQVSGERAQLQWETVSETNNAGFDIQHKAPTEERFRTLGFVEGHGTTDTPQSYRFNTDALQAGTHTFRLRQVDLDGTEEIHEAITVQVRQGEVMRMAGPNPVAAGATTSFTVQLDQQDDVTVAVYNVLGQRVQTLHAGSAQPNEVLRLTLDTSGLASGMYFVRVQGNSVRETQRVTVVR